MDDDERKQFSHSIKAYHAAQDRGRLRHEAIHQHIETCCQIVASGAVLVAPWDWDEDNNRVCAKCGESLEGRYK